MFSHLLQLPSLQNKPFWTDTWGILFFSQKTAPDLDPKRGVRRLRGNNLTLSSLAALNHTAGDTGSAAAVWYSCVCCGPTG